MCGSTTTWKGCGATLPGCGADANLSPELGSKRPKPNNRPVSKRLLVGRGRGFQGGVIRGLQHILEQPLKVIQACGRDNNGVAAPVDVFGNPEKTTPWIFLERKNECLPLNLHLVRLNSFLD